MKGLESLLPYIITILSLWLATIILIQLFKRATIKSIERMHLEDPKRRKKAAKTSAVIASNIASVIALVLLLLSIMFLFNPSEQPAERIGNKITMRFDSNFTETPNENIEAVERPKDAVEKKK